VPKCEFYKVPSRIRATFSSKIYKSEKITIMKFGKIIALVLLMVACIIAMWIGVRLTDPKLSDIVVKISIGILITIIGLILRYIFFN